MLKIPKSFVILQLSASILLLLNRCHKETQKNKFVCTYRLAIEKARTYSDAVRSSFPQFVAWMAFWKGSHLLQRKPPFLFALSPSVSSVVRGAVSVRGRGRGRGGLPGDRGQLFYGLDVAAQAVHKLPVPLCKTTGWHVGGDTAILTYIISINNVDEPPPRFRLLTYMENPSTMTLNWQCKMKSGLAGPDFDVLLWGWGLRLTKFM